MLPIVPFLAWTGGIAAGAQVARGIVRGTGALLRGEAGTGLVELADGIVSPVRTAASQVGRLGGDLVCTVFGVLVPQTPRRLPTESVPRIASSKRRLEDALSSENGLRP